MFEVACRERDGKIVRHGVRPHHGAVHAGTGGGTDVFIDKSAGFVCHEAPVALELVGKGFLHASREEVTEVADEVIVGSPDERGDFLCLRTAVQDIDPGGKHGSIVGSGAPASCFVVEPDGAVGGVSCTEDGCVAIGGTGIDECFAFRCYLQFVADGGDAETGRCHGIRGLHAGEGGIFGATHGTQGGTVKATESDNPMIIGRGACRQRRRGRRAVGMSVRIFRMRIYPPLFQQSHETVFAVERDEGVHVVRAKLVNEDVDDNARQVVRGGGATLSRRQHSDGCQQ